MGPIQVASQMQEEFASDDTLLRVSAEIATVAELKRVPVVHDGKLVGIVRSDLLGAPIWRPGIKPSE